MTTPDHYWLPDDIAAFHRAMDRACFIEDVIADINSIPVATAWGYPA